MGLPRCGLPAEARVAIPGRTSKLLCDGLARERVVDPQLFPTFCAIITSTVMLGSRQ
jgi:hypothetical protein